MTDSEICKRIAEIEGLRVASPREVFAREYNEGVCLILPNGPNGVHSYTYNPLTDDALCFQLMVKHKMQLTKLRCGDYICVKQNVFVNINNLTKGVSSPNKAICLAIIEAHKND